MKGVIAAGDGSTARAAAEALHAGGNAVDAAVAGAFGAFVAEPLLASAGGAGIMTIAPHDAEPFVVDFFSPVPGLGARPASLDFREVVIDFGAATQAFHVGRGSVAPPLALDGLALAASHAGTLCLADLVKPAVELARRGAPVSAEGAQVFELLWAIQQLSEEAVALAGGKPPKAGQWLANPELADLLEEFGDGDGRVPDRFVQALLRDFGPDAGGLLSKDDLEATRPEIVPARRFEVAGHTVLTSPKIGGQLIEVILSDLAGHSHADRETDEALRVALACRAGHRARYRPDVPGSTTHISVLDARGTAAAVTLTNGEGCGFVAPGTGVQLNNFLGEEDLNPGGFHRHAAGSPLPTMIAPTIALRDGRPCAVVGSGGSNRIRSVVSQVLDHLFRGAKIEDAVLAPRIHAEENSVWIELIDRPEPHHAVERLATEFEHVYSFPTRAFFFGGVHAATFDPKTGEHDGAGDPRRGGVVLRVD